MQSSDISFQRLRNNVRPNDLWGPPQDVLEEESKFYKSDSGHVETNNMMYTRKEKSAFDNPTFNTKL